MSFNKITIIAIVTFFAIIPQSMKAQKDADATIKSLAPLIYEYHGQLRMEKTDLLRNITRAYEHNPRMLTAIAKMFYDAQDSAVAHQYEQKALKADPKYAPAYVLRGDANLHLYQDTLAAINCYEKATTIAPNDASGYEALFNYYTKKRNALDSLQAQNLVTLLAQRADNDDSRMAAAELNRRIGGDFDTTISLLGAVSYDKLKESELARYAYMLCSNNLTDKCQEVVDKGLAQYPNNSYFYRVAMYNYAHGQNYSAAEEMGNKLFSMLPTDSIEAEDYRIYSYCLTERGEDAKAVESLWKAIQTTNPSWAMKQQLLNRIEEVYKKKADKLIADKWYEDAAAVLEDGADDFLDHEDEYRAVQCYSALGNMYTQTWANELEDAEKLLPYRKALAMYADMSKKCKDEDYITSGLYRQCFMSYFINRIDPNESCEPYARAFADRVLTHNTLGFYDKNMTKALQILASTQPNQALSYANRFQAKFPNYIDRELDDLIDKLSQK